MTNQSFLGSKDTSVARAKSLNLAFIHRVEKRASAPNSVLGPCLNSYKTYVEAASLSSVDLLDNLSNWLIGAKEETERIIKENMGIRWQDAPERISSSVTNSLRRSAGTNYQTLVSYALAQYLVSIESAWYLEHPVPKNFREALTIIFTANVDDDNKQTQMTRQDELEAEDGDNDDVKVQPDVDILLRNAAWSQETESVEPVILLSVKTSLVDRAGMAARWKTYFDLATRPCPHRSLDGCIYDKLGMSMENASRYNITHGIVTANIYKYWFHDERYQAGELSSGQTRSNTYMFELKLTTRNDDRAYTPSDWRQFTYIASVLKRISQEHKLPE